MSHELFHDVTDRRPTQGKARGGTLFISILAHAAILIAVVVVPLMATDVLPTITDGLAEYAVPVDLPPPVAVQRPQTRTPAVTPTNVANVAPVEPPDAIVAEAPIENALVCAGCVVGPALPNAVLDSIGSRVDPVLPPPPPAPVAPKIIRATAGLIVELSI